MLINTRFSPSFYSEKKKKKMSTQKNYVELNRTKQKMPLVGLGTARIDRKETEEVVYNAIKTGYRLIDAALLYQNEAEVGKAIKRALSDGIVKREELFGN